MFAFLCWTFFFFFSCIIFSHVKWPIQESLIQNWKGNIRKHILFQEGKKIEIFNWWFSELPRLLSISCFLFCFVFKLMKISRLCHIFCLIFLVIDIQLEAQIYQNVTIRVSLTQLLLVYIELPRSCYWKKGSPPSHWHTAKTSWKSSSVFALCDANQCTVEWGQLGELTSLLLWTKLQMLTCFNNLTEVWSHLVMEFLFLAACSGAFNRRQITNTAFIICFGWYPMLLSILSHLL